MSKLKHWVLVLQDKEGKKTWSSFISENCAEADSKIYRRQGYKIIGMAEIMIEDEFECFSLSDYPEDEDAKRFGDVYSKDPRHFIIGNLGGYEISRKDLVALNEWTGKAIKYCGEHNGKL